MFLFSWILVLHLTKHKHLRESVSTFLLPQNSLQRILSGTAPEQLCCKVFLFNNLKCLKCVSEASNLNHIYEKYLHFPKVLGHFLAG